jgi:hypothetical protein
VGVCWRSRTQPHAAAHTCSRTQPHAAARAGLHMQRLGTTQRGRVCMLRSQVAAAKREEAADLEARLDQLQVCGRRARNGRCAPVERGRRHLAPPINMPHWLLSPPSPPPPHATHTHTTTTTTTTTTHTCVTTPP